jgi:hypothetical protein
LTQGWTAGLEIAYRLRQGGALVRVIVSHLLVTHRPPSVDFANDGRKDRVFVIDVLREHAIEVFGPLAQGVDVLHIFGRYRIGKPINLRDCRSQLGVVGENSRSHVAYGHVAHDAPPPGHSPSKFSAKLIYERNVCDPMP